MPETKVFEQFVVMRTAGRLHSWEPFATFETLPLAEQAYALIESQGIEDVRLEHHVVYVVKGPVK